MELYSETKFLQFWITDRKAKTVVMSVKNKNSWADLGVIKWYGPWRQYCFHVDGDGERTVIFNNTCLQEITDVVTALNAEQKKKS